MGVRNSLLIAIAPTATIASIVGCYECIEPQISNLFKRETLSGEFLQVNRYLVDRAEGARPLERRDARRASRWPRARSSSIDEMPDDLKVIYRTVWEVPMRSLIDMARDRNAFIDQSQSLNLFCRIAQHRQAQLHVYVRMEERPQDHLLSALASRHAHRQNHRRSPSRPSHPAASAVTCSLENPGSCEACQ